MFSDVKVDKIDTHLSDHDHFTEPRLKTETAKVEPESNIANHPAHRQKVFAWRRGGGFDLVAVPIEELSDEELKLIAHREAIQRSHIIKPENGPKGLFESALNNDSLTPAQKKRNGNLLY